MVRVAYAAGVALAAVLLTAVPGEPRAQQTPLVPAQPQELRIGYVELSTDKRYSDDHAYARIQLRPLGRPYVGAEVALAEAESIGRAIRTTFTVERFAGVGLDDIAAAVDRWAAERKIHFVLADLPAMEVADLSRRMQGKPLLILNISAAEDELRGKDCQSNLLHTAASHSMQADAVAQYLVARKWPSVLVLQGPLPEDALLVAAFRRSAARFGLKLADVRPFQLTNDPRQREQSNVSLLTGGLDYDVVFVADSDGEYGRYVPYATLRPRPVVGTTGLVPETWHWAWERNGGPQVNSRFEKRANRRMTGQDWAAWIGVKAIVQSVLRTRSTDFQENRDYLFGDKMRLDGSKGNPMSFRPWDGQLRQPLLLATHNAIIERAPIRGFLHQTNDLDTLGIDKPESSCRRS